MASWVLQLLLGTLNVFGFVKLYYQPTIQFLLVASLLNLLHQKISKYTWQSYPTILACAIATVFYFVNWFVHFEVLTVLLIVTTVLLQLASLVAITLLPVNELPVPTGKYGVGTIVDRFTVTNEYPEKWGGPTSLKIRSLYMRIWYPSDVSTQRKRTSIFLLDKHSDTEQNIFERFVGNFGSIPSLLLGHIASTKCYAVPSAPLPTDNEKYPVILYSHGQFSTPEISTSMCENLASYGYVVVAPYHLDGDKSPPGPTTRRQHELRHAIDRITEAAQNPRLVLGIRKNNANNGSPTSSPSSTAAFHPPPAPTSSPDPKKDREMVLPAGLLYDRIDLRRGVGLLGHSFGALTSLLACTSTSAMDSQRGVNVVCGCAMDAWLHPLAEDQIRSRQLQVNRPLLLLNSELWLSKKGDLEKLKLFRENSASVLHSFTIKNALHQNFTDVVWHLSSKFMKAILLPPKWMLEEEGETPILGPCDGRIVSMVLKSVVRDYFRQYFSRDPMSNTNYLKPNQFYHVDSTLGLSAAAPGVNEANSPNASKAVASHDISSS